MGEWTNDDWNVLAEGFSRGYAGYRPAIIEAPDGATPDNDKRYLHLSPKYGMDAVQYEYFFRALALAQSLSLIPLDPTACALRVLEYPPLVGGAGHTDFSLLTLNLWRSHPQLLVCGTPKSPAHWGELAPLLLPPTRPTYHEILPAPETQRSLVFFALPDHLTPLGEHGTVGEWLEKRMRNTRVPR